MMPSSGPKGFKIGKNARLFFVVSSGGPDDKANYHPESTIIIRIFSITRPYLLACSFVCSFASCISGPVSFVRLFVSFRPCSCSFRSFVCFIRLFVMSYALVTPPSFYP